MRDANHPDRSAGLAEQLVATGLAGQTAGLQFLLFEMRALQRLLPGANPLETTTGPDLEAEFDNVPL